MGRSFFFETWNSAPYRTKDEKLNASGREARVRPIEELKLNDQKPIRTLRKGMWTNGTR
jgi:hypothetical protein